jgi:hypothetical protein
MNKGAGLHGTTWEGQLAEDEEHSEWREGIMVNGP